MNSNLISRIKSKVFHHYSYYYREKKRISLLPRYINGRTSILGNELTFVDSITFLEGLREIFEDTIYNFHSTNKYPYIIDCGSNIGMSIIYFKQKFPSAEIIGFEPDEKIFSILDNNIKNFGFGNVKLINKAVWKEEGSINFRIEGGYSGRIALSEDTRTQKVETIDLMPFLDRSVDFLKMDIEGAECEVLLNIKEKLANVKKIFIEYHSPKNEHQRLDEILSTIMHGGFRYYIKEAFVPQNPYLQADDLDDMDLQLNIFGVK